MRQHTFFEEKCRDAPYGDWIADGRSTVFDSNPYLILVLGRAGRKDVQKVSESCHC